MGKLKDIGDASCRNLGAPELVGARFVEVLGALSRLNAPLVRLSYPWNAQAPEGSVVAEVPRLPAVGSREDARLLGPESPLDLVTGGKGAQQVRLLSVLVLVLLTNDITITITNNSNSNSKSTPTTTKVLRDPRQCDPLWAFGPRYVVSVCNTAGVFSYYYYYYHYSIITITITLIITITAIIIIIIVIIIIMTIVLVMIIMIIMIIMIMIIVFSCWVACRAETWLGPEACSVRINDAEVPRGPAQYHLPFF